MLASIGIEKGKPRTRRADEEDPHRSSGGGQCHGTGHVFKSRIKEAFFYPNSAWCTPFIGGSHEFLAQPGVRNLDARTFFFYYATGITPAMSMKMVGVGPQYARPGRGLRPIQL